MKKKKLEKQSKSSFFYINFDYAGVEVGETLVSDFLPAKKNQRAPKIQNQPIFFSDRLLITYISFNQ